MEGYYRVQSGDTLWGIARKFNTTVDEIKRLNKLTNNSLSIGQLLYIPVDNNTDTESDTYIVKKGDTLYGIAKKYNLSVDELKNLNNLTSNTLSIGQKLLVKNNIDTDFKTYTVIKGDTLYKIANEFGVSVDEIKSANNLTSNNLSIGQVLKIPSNSEKEFYIVKSGDTLYGIARIYNTTVSKIKELNNLKSDSLSIGQKLLIPS